MAIVMRQEERVTTAYRLTPKAREGFLRIAFYFEERFGREVAERVVTDLENGFELLARNPDIGHRREDLNERVLLVDRHELIAYRSNPEWVEVGARSWWATLDLNQ